MDELEQQSGITVAELIDILSQHPADAVVEMAIIAPITPDDDDITVDRYQIDGLMPWDDGDEDSGPLTVWMIGGEDSDVDVFLDTVEQPDTAGAD